MAGYGDDDGYAAWLAANGYTPSNTLTPAVQRQRGSGYVDAVYEARFPGVRTGGYAQERAWPRTGAEVHGSTIPSDTIPDAVVQASYAAAYYEDQNPGALSVAVSAAAAIKSEQVGPLKTEYFEGTGNAVADAVPILSVVEGLLAPLISGYGPAVFVV